MTPPQVQRVALSAITPNPDNPRVIRDERFAKLVQSIKDFPEMLDLRPIVVNADGVVLGGNMRLGKTNTGRRKAAVRTTAPSP